jgi:hypothetical protein
MELPCLLFAILVGGGIAVASVVNMFMPFIGGASAVGSIVIAITGAAIAASAILVMKGKL